MNVNLLQSRIRVLLLCTSVLLGIRATLSAQGGTAYKQLVTSVSETVTDTVIGVDLDINEVSPQAKHGNVSVVILSSGGSGNPYLYEIRYIPDAGFLGVDTFTLEYNYIGSYPYLTYRAYRVSVYPSVLTARNDFAVTSTGVQIAIDVLANDAATNGPVTIHSIPLVKNGTAVINGSQILFTPVPGFAGVTHLNYVVCDAFNTCKTAQAAIGVHENALPDTAGLRVATAKNTKLKIPLALDGYSVFQNPSNGTVQLQNGQVFTYAPNTNFTGVDQFVLSNEVSGTLFFKTVTLDVLSAPMQNTMAIDDRVYTPQGQAISFNVRDNDIGNLTVKSWSIPSGLPGIVSGTSGSGNVTFTPDSGFIGVATFYYKIGNMFVSDLEIATVNVIVGNMNPRAGEFHLTTAKETPLIINYQIPFIGFDFSVFDPPENGSCAVYPGFTTQTFNGQTVSGHNLLVYTPNSGFTGLDDFAMSYCVTANGQCQNVKIALDVTAPLSQQGPYCIEDCVWAGDVNRDGIVNNKDVLPLGYLMGFDGLQRPDASLEWFGQFSPNWNNPYTDLRTDLKHADTDGNGTVSTEDTLAIGLFYGQTHNLIPGKRPVGKGMPFFLNVLTPNPGIGDLVEVEVSLGCAPHPVLNVYGFTFDITLGQNIIASGLQMEYYDNSWLNRNAPSLWMDKNPESNRLETAFTRTGGTGCSGYGVVGKFDFIIIDVIVGAKPLEPNYARISLTPPEFMWADGQNSVGENFILNIPLRPVDEKERGINVLNDALYVYPSPASDVIKVHLNGEDLIESLSIFDMSGREVYHSGNVQWEHAEIPVQEIPGGIYVALARTASGVQTRKFQVLH